MRIRAIAPTILLSLALAGGQTPPAPAALPATEVRYGPGLVGGILINLARQAGLEARVPAAAATLVSVREQEVGPFNEVFPEFVLRHLPGWGWRLEGQVLVVGPGVTPQAAPAPAAAPAAPAARAAPATPPTPATPPAPEQPRYLILAGGAVVAEGPLPTFQPAMVVDAVVFAQGNALQLVLSPLGPACLIEGAEQVCLRAMNPGDRGVIDVRLGGKTYAVAYQVESENLVLYRYAVRASGQSPRLAAPAAPAAPAVSSAPAPQAPRQPQPAVARPASPAPAAKPPAQAKPQPAKPAAPAPAAPAAKPPAPAAPAKPVALQQLAPGLWVLDREGGYQLGGLRLRPEKGDAGWLQVGAFGNLANALDKARALQQQGFSAAVYRRANGITVVLAGPAGDWGAARLRALGYQPLRFRVP